MQGHLTDLVAYKFSYVLLCHICVHICSFLGDALNFISVCMLYIYVHNARLSLLVVICAPSVLMYVCMCMYVCLYVSM